MSGPNALEDGPSSAPISRVPSLPTITQDHQGDEYPPSRPNITKPRSGSVVSRVNVEFFDPAGVQDLRRTLTHKSIQEKPSFSSSVATLTGLTGGDGAFDFEKTLRHVIRKYSGSPHMDINPYSLFKKIIGVTRPRSSPDRSVYCSTTFASSALGHPHPTNPRLAHYLTPRTSLKGFRLFDVRLSGIF